MRRTRFVQCIYVTLCRYRSSKAAEDFASCNRIRSMFRPIMRFNQCIIVTLCSMFGSIMQSYKEEYYWWEVVAISRRFLICACAALLSPRVDALTLTIFVILSASLLLHVRAAPFLFPLNNSLETANLATVMFNYLAGILFSSNLLDNFDGMDVFVVCVNAIAIVLMVIAAFWVWKFAPDLSQKLGVSQALLVPTVISKIVRTLSVSHRSSASATDMKPPSAASSASPPPPDSNLDVVVPSDALPHRVEHALHLPQLPPLPASSSLPALPENYVVLHVV